jgi:sulfur relay (sulfurtransferase) DsrF/TusC family protein
MPQPQVCPMTRSLLFIVRGDPRTSPRPAEALRIVAGLCAVQQVSVRLVLMGPAVRLLGQETGELLEDDQVERCRPLLVDAGQPVLVIRGSLEEHGIGVSAVPCREISNEALARISAESDSVALF